MSTAQLAAVSYLARYSERTHSLYAYQLGQWFAWWPSSRAALDDRNLGRLLEAPEEYVVKPRVGHGGTGIVVCAHAKQEDVRRCLAAVRERPETFVAQPTIALSTHPTAVHGQLVARHVDLRPFVFSTPAWTRAVPAGLTRVAWGEGALVVNSSQAGGGKATWALR